MNESAKRMSAGRLLHTERLKARRAIVVATVSV